MKKARNIFLMIFAIVFWVVGALYGLPKMINGVYHCWYGQDRVWLLSGNLSVLPIILAIIFFAICVWLYSPYGLLANMYTGQEGLKAKLPLKIKIIITIISLLVVILGSLFSTLWHDVFTKDGVHVYHFGVEREYSWEDAKAFRLKSDYNGVLIFEVTMKDGRDYYFNGGFFRGIEYSSTKYDREFPDYDYTIYLAKELARNEVKMELSDWKKVKKDLVYDSWDELAEAIRENYEKTVEQMEKAS